MRTGDKNHMRRHAKMKWRYPYHPEFCGFDLRGGDVLVGTCLLTMDDSGEICYNYVSVIGSQADRTKAVADLARSIGVIMSSEVAEGRRYVDVDEIEISDIYEEDWRSK